MSRATACLYAFALLTAGAAPAAADAVSRPDAHAPIGVMGDHMHHAGEWMLSYRFGFLRMTGNRDGTDRQGVQEVLRGFPVTPTEMDVQRHVFGAMWAPLEDLTLLAMLPVIGKTMDHRTRAGGGFSTESFGVGDLKVSGLVRLLDRGGHHLHANAGVSLPTGSVSERDNTPMGDVRLPYPMQLGSGTFDLLPGLTYTGVAGDWSWGAQAAGTIRTGRNGKGYRLGHEYQTTAWLGRRWGEWISTSVRLAWRDWGNISGDDDALDPRLVPTADPDLRAGRRLDALAGINVIVPRGPLRGNRLALEMGWPLWQSLRGPQLERDWSLTLGWQLAFGP